MQTLPLIDVSKTIGPGDETWGSGATTKAPMEGGMPANLWRWPLPSIVGSDACPAQGTSNPRPLDFGLEDRNKGAIKRCFTTNGYEELDR